MFQPSGLRDGALRLVEQLAPELIAVAAYGRIIPDEILEFPKYGCINVHSSLLPKYRGAAPIHWAILNGESETGVTIMHMASELDAGDIIKAEATPIRPDESAEELHDRLSAMGARLLCEVVAELEAGRFVRTPQDHTKATFAPMLSRGLSQMDWSRSAYQLHNQVRGLLPWPAAVACIGGVRCKIFKAHVSPERTERTPGTILAADNGGIKIACGQGTVLVIDQLRPDGGKRMTAAEYLRGHPVLPDCR